MKHLNRSPYQTLKDQGSECKRLPQPNIHPLCSAGAHEGAGNADPKLQDLPDTGLNRISKRNPSKNQLQIV